MTIKTIYITLVNDEPCTNLNGKLQSTIKNLQKVLDEVPDQYKDLVQIEFSSDYDGGMDYDIQYRRPKTDEEIKADEDEALRLKEQKLEKLKASERAEKRLYQRLKKKYEG